MKNRIKRLNNNKVKKLVNERLKKDGTFVHESKIDRAIQHYLLERATEEDSVSTQTGEVSFTDKAKNTFEHIGDALSDMVEDLMIIQAEEGDVLVDMFPTEVYSEEALEHVINAIEHLQEAIDDLKDLNPSDFEDFKNAESGKKVSTEEYDGSDNSEDYMKYSS